VLVTLKCAAEDNVSRGKVEIVLLIFLVKEEPLLNSSHPVCPQSEGTFFGNNEEGSRKRSLFSVCSSLSSL